MMMERSVLNVQVCGSNHLFIASILKLFTYAENHEVLHFLFMLTTLMAAHLKISYVCLPSKCIRLLDTYTYVFVIYNLEILKITRCSRKQSLRQGIVWRLRRFPIEGLLNQCLTREIIE